MALWRLCSLFSNYTMYEDIRPFYFIDLRSLKTAGPQNFINKVLDEQFQTLRLVLP